MEEKDYKQKYYVLIEGVGKLRHRCEAERCPPFKQCCGACILLGNLVNSEKKKNKKERYEDDSTD